MLKENYNRSNFDHCVYFKQLKGNLYIYLLIYVDDMLIACKDNKEISKLTILTLNQTGYIKKVIDLFQMQECKLVSIPMSPQYKLSAVKGSLPKVEEEYMKNVPYSNAVGSLMYAMICTRPDIAYGVSLVSRFMGNPSKEHWKSVKWMLRYLKGTVDKGLVFSSNTRNDSCIEGYCDSDFAADLDRRRSLTGYAFTLGGNLISWKANLQHIVALSTTEAEYVALIEAIKEAIWLQGITKELGLGNQVPRVHCDSQSAIHLSKNSAFHERTKHIDVRLHYVRDVISKGQIKVDKISTEINPADILTKPVSVVKFEQALSQLKVLPT